MDQEFRVPMRLLSFRLIVSLIVGITLVSFVSSWYQVQREKNNLRGELDHRAAMLGESLAGNAERLLDSSSKRGLEQLVERFGNREHLDGIAIYDKNRTTLAMTSGLSQLVTSAPPLLGRAIAENQSKSEFARLGGARVHIYALPLHRPDEEVGGGLIIVHDTAYIRAATLRAWRESFVRVMVQVFVIVLVTLLIVRWSLTGPIAHAAQWMKALRTGTTPARDKTPDWDFLRPLAHEVETIAQSINQARSAAETEARLREANESLWTAGRLAIHVRGKLGESRLFVVSNREPYTHNWYEKSVQVTVPASGLVTALELVLQACDGTWVAHGSGSADREVVDDHDRLRVPPEEPRYNLRRVWLSWEEEEGYYYGFANEGLWPLCHIAHTRPTFRASDWKFYRDTNRKFADAVLGEMEGVDRPVLLAQDYHFALLPRMVKEKRPDARVAIFWHIPWPNPEAFSICPWQRELLDGLLGADLIGFHVQAHCNNFLNTVDRALESRIDWEHFSAKRGDHSTMVRPFPISVGFPEDISTDGDRMDANAEHAAIVNNLGIEATILGIGVDRVDYTKGILERFQSVERFLERYPSYQNRFTFIQIGAPSRTHIKRYLDLQFEVEAEANRINARFQRAKWRPIVFLNRQHTHEEIQHYYRAADLCLVTSLHDGMNLVAKEYLAARRDEQGGLILSRFTGAARELLDALIVNPYDIDETAEAIRFTLEMDAEERSARMRRLRKVVKEHNVYWWAGSLIAELCEVRLDQPRQSHERVSDDVSAA